MNLIQRILFTPIRASHLTAPFRWINRKVLLRPVYGLELDEKLSYNCYLLSRQYKLFGLVLIGKPKYYDFAMYNALRDYFWEKGRYPLDVKTSRISYVKDKFTQLTGDPFHPELAKVGLISEYITQEII